MLSPDFNLGSIGGLLDPSRFVQGTAASDADDRFIYNQSTGILLYDADGIGAAPALHLLTLENRVGLTAANVRLVTSDPA